MDVQTIRERLKQLQAEMARLRREDRLYDRTRKGIPQDVRAHESRIAQMQQLIQELRDLIKKAAEA